MDLDCRGDWWRCICRWQVHSPNELMGIPPKGQKVSVWMGNIWRLPRGKAVECWFNMDTLGFMQQRGHSANG
ncbi:MAG: ester cyclase [Anaerolineales bacterium]|nr:ester cyclase [Anaerolineales bacterium]